MHKSEQQTARFCATQILCRLYQTRRPVKLLFEQSVAQASLSPADRRLMMQLIYGVLRHRQHLDRMIEILSKTPLQKIDPFIHQSLVIGLFQLFFLERIPPSAAVNEAVKNCRKAGLPKRLHGFVNGILRESIRQKDSLKNQAEYDRSGGKILNHPAWLVRRWQKMFGREITARICTANNLEPVLVLRSNRLHQTRDEFLNLLHRENIGAEQGYFSPDAVILPEYSGPVHAIPGYDRGYFQVQDEAPQLATLLLGPFEQGGTYLDGCAGLGSKTAHLIELGSTSAIHVHAVEPDLRRHGLFLQNMSRLSPARKPELHLGPLQQFTSRELPPFQGIIIDAPCSGTGVTGRHPDIRWNRRPEDILSYQRQQLHLLNHGATLLASGGVLVYASCSLEDEENHEVIKRFLIENDKFVLTDCTEQLPEAAHQFIREGCFAPLPSEKIDGFFAARLVHIG